MFLLNKLEIHYFYFSFYRRCVHPRCTVEK